jgi:hypothetical protein
MSASDTPTDGDAPGGNRPRKAVTLDDVDRGLGRAVDYERVEFARKLLLCGMHTNLVHGLLPSISEARVKKIAEVNNVVIRVGRPPTSAVAIFKKASVHLDATLFAITYQSLSAMDEGGTISTVSIPTLIDAYETFSALFPSPPLEINLAYIIVRDLASKSLSLDCCKMHDTEFLRSAVPVSISERYSHGECPHCRALDLRRI